MESEIGRSEAWVKTQQWLDANPAVRGKDKRPEGERRLRNQG